MRQGAETPTKELEAMTTDEQYNGWANYETWVVNLWLTNDQGTDEDVRELAQDTARLPEAQRVRTLADELRSYVENLPEYERATEEASFVSDLLGHAIERVDWRELAENFLSDVDEQ